MNIRSFKSIATSLCAVLLVTGAASAADAPAPSAKWRVTFAGQAASDGQMQFRVTPQTGEPILVNAKIRSGRGESFIAQDLRDAFKSQLPKRIYRCEVLHAQEVVLKAGHDEPMFTLELVESTVAGSRVKVASN